MKTKKKKISLLGKPKNKELSSYTFNIRTFNGILLEVVIERPKLNKKFLKAFIKFICDEP